MSVSTTVSKADGGRSVVFCRYGQSHEIAVRKDGAGVDNFRVQYVPDKALMLASVN
jgi:hypothetical protein